VNHPTVYTVNKTTNKPAAERGDTMTAVFGMMAMVPVLFASAGYVLVSAGGTAEYKRHKADD
jgi:hypothetical protein